MADQVVLSSGELRNNALSSRISVCSEISGINEESISLFYSRYFSGWSSPIFGTPVDERSYEVGQNILFIASDGHVGSLLHKCLKEHALVSDGLEEYVGKEAENLGKGLDVLEGIQLPSYYNPISASWGYQKIDNWLIVSFMSQEEEIYRVNHALTNLFGLNVSICETSSVCVQKK